MGPPTGLPSLRRTGAAPVGTITGKHLGPGSAGSRGGLLLLGTGKIN
jgi:hypothetical protein